MFDALREKLGISFWGNTVDDSSSKDKVSKTTSLAVINLGIMNEVLLKKKVNKKTVSKWELLDPSLILGDIFTSGYLIFQTVLSFKPAWQAISAIGIATGVLGIVAGVVNIAVSWPSLREGLRCMKAGDKLTGTRLLIDAVLGVALGAVLILASLSMFVACMAGVGAFFTAFPWILPLIFLLISAPIMYELGVRVHRIWTKQNPGTQLLDIDKELKERPQNKESVSVSGFINNKLKDKPTLKPEELENFKGEQQKLFDLLKKYRERGMSKEDFSNKFGELDKELRAKFYDKIGINSETWKQVVEAIQSIDSEDAEEGSSEIKDLMLKYFYSEMMQMLCREVGVPAGMETFKLLSMIAPRGTDLSELQVGESSLQSREGSGEMIVEGNDRDDKVREQLKKTTGKIKKWYVCLGLRSLQQAAFVAAFGLSIGAICNRSQATVLNGAQNATLVFTSLIPGFLDAFRPFGRNTPATAPPVVTPEILEAEVGKKKEGETVGGSAAAKEQVA